jgi:hypothetical protein
MILMEAVVAQLKHYPSICLDGLRKTMETHSEDTVAKILAEIPTDHSAWHICVMMC